MRTVAIVSQKGGAGKTTLALHLASSASAAGLVTVVIDTDPQATASRWSQWRQGRDPDVIDCGAPSLLQAKLAKVAELGAQLAVIDTPPHADAMARQAAKLADLILVPCRPRAFDLAAVEATADLVQAARKPAFLVFVAGPPKASVIYQDAADLVASADEAPLTIAPHRLSERAAFHHSTARGQTAEEFEPGGKAAAEGAALWQWTCEQLHLSACEPVPAAARAG